MIELHVRSVREVCRQAVEGEAVTIGRASENTLVLSSRTVSRHHCVIEPGDDGLVVRDLGSHYGTTVNGTRIETAPLVPGDTIGVGRFTITALDPAAAPAGDLPPASTPAELLAHVLQARAEVESDQASLAARAAALETREATPGDVEASTAAFEARIAAAEAAAADAERERDEARAALQADRDRQRTEEEAAREHHDAATRRGAELEAEMEAMRTRLAEREATRADERSAETDARRAVESTLEETQRRARGLEEGAARVERDLASTSKRLQEATASIETLREVLRQREATEVDARERATAAESRAERLEAIARPLHAAAERLGGLQQTLADLEAMWLDVDADVEDAEHAGPEAIAAAMRQRELVAQQLEATHEERDEMLAAVHELMQRYAAAADDDARREPGGSAWPWPRRRRPAPPVRRP